MAGDISRQNGQKGGRRPGTKNAATLEKEAALKLFQERVRANVEPLFASQFALARGVCYLIKVQHGKKPKVVDDLDEILAYLGGEPQRGKGIYYYIATDKPDNDALDSLLDRTFGKAAQVIDHTGSVTIEDGDIRALMTDLSPDDQQKFRETLAQFVATAKSNREARTRPRDVGTKKNVPKSAPDLPEDLPPADQVAKSTQKTIR